MSALKDKYQSVGQFFKDVKRTVEDIVTRLSDVETRIDESVGGGALPQEEENGKEYKAGEGILITDDDSVVLNYNGPFAYHLDHIDTTTTTTLWVTRSVGYVVRNGIRKTVYANTTPAPMASGESAWMLYNTDADSYSISIQTNAPTATSDKICVKLAENVDGVLRQIQFGEVVVTTSGGTSTTSLGFPDYSSGMAVSGGTTYGGYATDGWLIGDVSSPNSAYATGDCECTVTLNGIGFSATVITLLKTIGLTNFQNYAGVITNPVFLPIPAGTSFRVNPSVVLGQEPVINLAYYSCITQ